MEKNNQQIFLQKYKVFEDWAREHFPKMQDMHYLENNYALRDYCKTLEFYRYVRNILTHYGYVGITPVTNMLHITDAMLNEFDTFFAEISEPAINKAVHIENIISHTVNDNVLDAARDMVRRNYTHCPILSNGKIIGLFGENVLFKIICKGINVNEDTIFSDILDEIDIYKSHFARSITSESTIPECKYKFTRAIEKNERLDILFFTEDGTYQTPLKGLITIWDMPAINHDSDNS